MLGPLSEITCQDLTKLPYGMYHARSVVIEDVVYVGGGYTAAKDGVNNLVFKFIAKDNVWVILPPCTVTQFGLAAINGKPVTIGGRDILSGGKPTAACFEFDSETDSWQKSTSISDMPTARYGLDCVSDSERIVAVGGIVEDGTSCKHVEIFFDDSKRWYAGYSLPKSQKVTEPRKFYVPERESGVLVGCGSVLTNSVPEPILNTSSSWCAVVNNHLFVKLSNTAVVYAPVSLISVDQERKCDEYGDGKEESCGSPIVSAPPLFSSGPPRALQSQPAYRSVKAPTQPSLKSTTTSGQSAFHYRTPSSALECVPSRQTTQKWKNLVASLTDCSPLINLRGCLACLGKKSSDPGTLFVFVSSRRAWLELFELPSGSYDYSCAAVLSNGDVLIIGGRDANNISSKVVRIRVA